MSLMCAHGLILGRCPDCEVFVHPRLGVFPVPERDEPALNVDRFGMPLDYQTYEWLLYGRRVEDNSPARLAFLHHESSNVRPPSRPDPMVPRGY